MSFNISAVRGLRAANQRLLILAMVLLFAGIAWAAYHSTTGGSSDTAPPSTQSGGGEVMGGAFPAPGLAPGGDTTAEFAKDEDGRSSAVDPSIPSMAPAPAPGEPSVQNVLGRTVIRSGSMEIQVDSVSASFDRVRQVAEGHGGFVADSNFGGSEERQHASLTLRIPAERFSQAVEDLRNMAVEVRHVSTSAQDVTEEFADLQATIRNLTAVEAQYLSLLGEAQGIGEILQVQDRLNQVRLQIDRTQGRINLLDNLASLATLHVMLTPVSEATVSESSGGIGGAVRDAWQSSIETVEAIVTAIVFAVVWSWWLLPVAVVAIIAWRRFAPRATGITPAVDTPESAA